MLNQTGLQGDKEFLVEILMLSLLRHPNLVNMIGYCAEGNQRLLVYEFMPLGSLEYHLHGRIFCPRVLEFSQHLFSLFILTYFLSSMSFYHWERKEISAFSGFLPVDSA